MDPSGVDTKALQRFCTKHKRKIRELGRCTHFNQTQLDCVVIVYFQLMAEQGPHAQHVSHGQFVSFLDIVFNMPSTVVIDRVLSVMDFGTCPVLTLDMWVRTLSLFLHGTLAERIRYCYRVYDLNGEGAIRREHLLKILEAEVALALAEDSDELVKEIADTAMKLLDRDLDAAISFEDYDQAVTQSPCLLETLGRCMPDRAAVHAFLNTFTICNRF